MLYMNIIRGKVRSLIYSTHTRKLVSSADDGHVGVWDVETQREETAEWGAGNTCEKCGICSRISSYYIYITL